MKVETCIMLYKPISNEGMITMFTPKTFFLFCWKHNVCITEYKSPKSAKKRPALGVYKTPVGKTEMKYTAAVRHRTGETYDQL